MKVSHHSLEAAKLIALDSGDYHETQHAIHILDEEAKILDGGRETAAEVAARLIAEYNTQIETENAELKKLLTDIQDWMMDNDYECGSVGSQIYSDINKALNHTDE